MGTEEILETEFRRHLSPDYSELYKKNHPLAPKLSIMKKNIYIRHYAYHYLSFKFYTHCWT